MKWQPYIDFKKDCEILPVTEPPCKFCIYWKPIRRYDHAGRYDGVQMCGKREMINDFSCYEQNLEKES